ncbi:unnamed protein product [Anisakis simplex]|uniref:Methyltranfer_dom domain-containing protein n=1 Tax=Anisakis simplex TaxID=6269 RepID=A0A0M3JDR5_ANISI|nr:unnamed protein product [Anisakis simplex]
MDSSNGETNEKADKVASSNEAITDKKGDVHSKASDNEQSVDGDLSSSATTQPIESAPEDDKKRGCEEAHSDVCEEIAKKKAKIESDVEMSDKASKEGKPAVSSQATVLLDVCCGTGTIGLCLMSLLRKSNRLSNHHLVGIEMVPEAVEDAKVNAETNHFKENE